MECVFDVCRINSWLTIYFAQECNVPLNSCYQRTMNSGGSAEGGLVPAGRVNLKPGQRGLIHKNLCAIEAGGRNSSGEEFSLLKGKAGGVCVCMQK